MPVRYGAIQKTSNSNRLLYNKQGGQYNCRLVLTGGIAQLGERLHGMQEVSGSIPLISTSFYFIHNTGPHRLEA